MQWNTNKTKDPLHNQPTINQINYQPWNKQTTNEPQIKLISWDPEMEKGCDACDAASANFPKLG